MSDPQLYQVAVRVEVEQRAKRAASGKRIMKMGLGALVGVLIVTGGFWLGEGGDITADWIFHCSWGKLGHLQSRNFKRHGSARRPLSRSM